jgi:hypothetical protein
MIETRAETQTVRELRNPFVVSTLVERLEKWRMSSWGILGELE